MNTTRYQLVLNSLRLVGPIYVTITNDSTGEGFFRDDCRTFKFHSYEYYIRSGGAKSINDEMVDFIEDSQKKLDFHDSRILRMFNKYFGNSVQIERPDVKFYCAQYDFKFPFNTIEYGLDSSFQYFYFGNAYYKVDHSPYFSGSVEGNRLYYKQLLKELSVELEKIKKDIMMMLELHFDFDNLYWEAS